MIQNILYSRRGHLHKNIDRQRTGIIRIDFIVSGQSSLHLFPLSYIDLIQTLHLD